MARVIIPDNVDEFIILLNNVKNFHQFFIIILLTIHSGFMAHSQTLVNLVNKERTEAGTITADFTSSTRDNAGHVYVAGNTITLPQQKDDAIVRKYEIGTGKLIWEYIYNDITDMADFATDVYAKGNYVYVTGSSTDLANGTSKVFTAVLDQSDGSEVTILKYSPSYSGYAVASSVKADGQGNVYVCGTEQTNASDFGIFVLAYDSNFTDLWQTYYDSVGRYDGAVALNITPSGRFSVTGYSGTAFSSWDFVTLKINKNTGALIQTVYSANGNGNISKPVDFTTDFNGDLYVLGETALSATNIDWKLIKYDTAFNQVWVRILGSADSLEDKPVSIAADYAGQLLITGYMSKSGGSTDATTVRMNYNGTTTWQRNIAAITPGQNAKAADLVLGNVPDTDFYICGSSYHQGDEDMFTAGYDINGNLRWIKYFNDTTDCHDHARDLQIDGSGLLYISGTTTTPADTSFVTVVYQEWGMPNVYCYDTSNIPLYKEGELIVRFNPVLINPSFANNADIQFADIGDVIPDSIVDILSTKVGFNMERATVGKIFKNITFADSLNVTREGDTIPTPKFWSTVLLFLPTGLIDTLQKTQDSLNTIPSLVFNAGKNLAFTYSTYPNDPEYPTTNGSFGSCIRSLCDATQGINVCPIWDDGHTGYDGLDIGIFDSGINYGHEEFVTAPMVSKAAQGYDFVTGMSIIAAGANNDTEHSGDGHGTGVASIAAGLSNNGFGGTGVAGGDLNGTNSNVGCLLVAMKATGTLAVLYEAIVMATNNPPSGGAPGFGIDIANFSLMMATDGSVMPIADKRVHQDAMRWLYNNGVTSVASSGECSTPFLGYSDAMPASVRDNWVIKVAGANNSGVGNTACPSGNLVDLIAPSMANQFVPASAQGNDQYLNLTSSNSYFGTSFSVPLVSGIASLLMSYIFENDNGFVLSPDDIENLLEIYAKNNQVGTTYGHGLVDAGNAYNHIKLPAYNIYHRTIQPPNSTNVTKVFSSKAISLTDNFESATSTFGSPTIFLQAGSYIADVYEIGSTVSSWNLPPNESIINYWKNNSKTKLWKAPNLIDEVVPESDYEIVSINNSGGALKGYAYHILSDANGNPVNKWVPVDVSGGNYGNGKVGISLHTYNPTVSGLYESIKPDAILSVFPNPTTDLITVAVKGFSDEDLTLRISDSLGRIVWSSAFQSDSVNDSFVINLSMFAQGVYTLVAYGTHNKEQTKFVVHHQ